MIAEAVSEKEAVEMKNMKPSETDPNDTAVLNQDSIIPTEANINPEGEKVDGESLQEEKVEIPSQVVLPNEVAASVNLEGSA